MAIPDYQAFMLPLLKLMVGGPRSVRACVPELIAHFGLDDAEAELLTPSGGKTVVADRAHWARTYLGKAGLLRSPKRGLHVITEDGKAVLAENPENIDNALLARFAGFDDWRSSRAQQGEAAQDAGNRKPAAARGAAAAAAPAALTPEERIAAAHAELTASLAEDLLAAVLAITPQRFERLVVDLLIAMGYGKGDPASGKAVGKSGDGGIDGIVNEDALGLDAVYVQAKRYAPGNTVGRPELQAFVGAMTGEGATKGVFFTTSAFTSGARDYVRMVQQRIVLIDGDRLARLMIEHGVGVRPQTRYTVLALDEAAFGDA